MGTSLVVGVRWTLPGKDAGSVRIRSDTGATEDAALGASGRGPSAQQMFRRPLLGDAALLLRPAESTEQIAAQHLVNFLLLVPAI